MIDRIAKVAGEAVESTTVIDAVGRLTSSRLVDTDRGASDEPSEHFYFDHDRLFGVYYRSAFDSDTPGPRSLPVLICPPIGHEHVRSHNALRKLCERLSGIGFPVLRFDYWGLGDSGGDGSDGDVSEWRNNIRAAAAELCRRSEQSELMLVGLRLGAALAVGIRLDGITIQNFVLWDPVVEGGAYLAELCDMHRHCLTDTRRFRTPQPPDRSSDGELLGFRYPACAQESISKLSLLNRPYPYENTFLVTSSRRPEYDALAKTLERNTRGRFTEEFVPDSPGWDDHGRIEAALIANRTIAAITAKIENGFV